MIEIAGSSPNVAETAANVRADRSVQRNMALSDYREQAKPLSTAVVKR